MIKKLVELELAKFKEQGYDCIVTTELLKIDSRIHIENIGNSIYFLTGILLGEGNSSEITDYVYIFSPISTLNFKQKRISEFGTYILKKFKNFIIVKTRRENSTTSDSALSNPYYLEFVKISPVKKTDD